MPVTAPPTHANPLEALLSAATLAELSSQLRSSPTVVLLQAPALLAELAAPEIFASLVPVAQARALDTHLLSPLEDAWTTQQLHDELLVPSQLTPAVRNVFFVLEAQTISTTLFDHLLKTIEEPLAPSTFVLVAPDTSALPVTIRSRATVSFTLDPSPAHLVAWLTSAGLPDDLAARAVRALPGAAVLLASLAGELLTASRLVDLASCLPDRSRPASIAAATAKLLETIAQLGDDPTAKATDTSATASTRLRKRVRRLAASLLDAWRALVIAHLHADPASASRVAARLEALDQAAAMLALNGPVELALARAIAA